jgi:hypothetical protein
MRGVVFIVTALIVAYLGAVLHVWANAGIYWPLIVTTLLGFYAAWLIDQAEKRRPNADEHLAKWSELPPQELEPHSQSDGDPAHTHAGRGQSRRDWFPETRASAPRPQLSPPVWH